MDCVLVEGTCLATEYVRISPAKPYVWSMWEVEGRMIVVTLPFPPSTNNLFINTSRGRIRSSKYDEWATEAGWELARQRPPKTLGPVSIHFDFQSGRDKRKRDITNLLKAPEDLLVKFKVIEADDNTIVQAISAGWSECVKGVQITITPLGESNDTGRQSDQKYTGAY